jgi:hypothetical protein
VKGFLDSKPAAPQAEQPAKPAEPAQPQAPKAAEEIKYDFQVPNEIVEAMGAEEPATRHKAVNALVNGLANKLAKDFGSAMAEMAKHVQAEAVKAALGQVDSRTSEQRVRDDFYSAHPDLKELADNLPAIDGVVWQTAQQIAQATGAKGWSKELRDQVGATLRLQLKLTPPPNGGAKPPAGGRQPRKPQFSAGSGPASARQNGAAEGNEFSDVLRAGG